VTGVVGGNHKVETVRGYGADWVIDTSCESLWGTAERIAPDGFDVILDANGGPSLRASFHHLRAPGKLIVYGFHTMFRRGRGRPDWPRLLLQWLRTPRFNPIEMTAENRSVLAFNLSYLFHETDLLVAAMTELLDWLARGRVRTLPTTPCAIDDVAQAHRFLESGRSVGKIVLTMG
jgi:NADPH:quinone reductase-like Zn-dependent oxidoreductase